jgi:hypothetical protein
MSNEKPAPQTGDAAALEPATENVAKLEPKDLVDFREAVEWLADQSESERSYWLPKKAEALHVVEKELRSTVTRVLRERALQTAAKRLEEDRAAKQRAEAAAKEQRDHDRVRKERARVKKDAELKAEREKRKAELKAEREQREAEKEAERKAKEKTKGFSIISKLPVALHEAELIKLSARIGEDATTLRIEFQEFIGVTEGSTLVETEAWDEPVNVVELLDGIEAKIHKYVVTRPYQRVACVLFDAQAWPHNAIATHSPILVATSPEPKSGKSVLLGVTARLTPKAVIHIETTGPNVFRLIDAHQPTIIIDEADDIFLRKGDLKHIINGSWQRGATVPRIVLGISRDFNIFSPKAIGLLSNKLPRALHTRGIHIKMRPKHRDDEAVEPFKYVDDSEFAVLRRKLRRFAIDHADALKTMEPSFPSGLDDRDADNWRLMLCIAELAGGQWPERAREALNC